MKNLYDYYVLLMNNLGFGLFIVLSCGCLHSKKPLSHKGLRVFLVLRPLRAACPSGGAAPQKPAREVWIPRVHSLKPGTPGRVPGLLDRPLNHRGSARFCAQPLSLLMPAAHVGPFGAGSPQGGRFPFAADSPFPLRSFRTKVRYCSQFVQGGF